MESVEHDSSVLRHPGTRWCLVRRRISSIRVSTWSSWDPPHRVEFSRSAISHPFSFRHFSLCKERGTGDFHKDCLRSVGSKGGGESEQLQVFIMLGLIWYVRALGKKESKKKAKRKQKKKRKSKKGRRTRRDIGAMHEKYVPSFITCQPGHFHTLGADL